jgi:hypothetical protein|tara:strand:- start:1653 stop:2183 length:531 start_codon:yes stop_codon:yes gene_type:complete
MTANSKRIEIRPLDYLSDIENLEVTIPELDIVKEKLLDRLEILEAPLSTTMKDVEDYDISLTDYWNANKHTYDVIPELQVLPFFQKVVQNYIIISHREKLLLVKAFIEILREANAVKQQEKDTKEQKQQEQEKKREKKKIDKELAKLAKEEKMKPKKELQTTGEFDEELEALENLE